MTRRTAEENRQAVLGVATRLFYERGIRAVGMDTVIREADMGNATVYRAFPSKDALATAYVQGCADGWFDRMNRAMESATDRRDKLAAVFEALAQETSGAGYRGCPMLNTNTEFPEGDHPAHLVSVRHKQSVRDLFHALAVEAGIADPDQLADELLIVLNGAYATAAVLDGPGYGARAAALARRLIGAA